MHTVENEWRELINRMFADKAFNKAKDQRDILQYLYTRRDNPPYAKDIEGDVYGRPPSHRLHNPVHARERIADFKKRLDAYALSHPSEKWHCDLPGAEDKEGYKLEFILKQTLVDQFWEPHFASGKQVNVVCDPLLFFYEHTQGRILRFVDTNIEGLDRKRALTELEKLHPSPAKEKLLAGHFYVDVGSLIASERLRDYFWKLKQVRVPMVIDKEGVGQEWTKGSPVLLGTAKTNSFIRKILRAPETKPLKYRLNDKFAWVTIDSVRDEERKALSDVLADGVEWSSDGQSFTTSKPELTIGIVSRFRDPRGGAGVITLITSDATRNTTQMAEALTDEKQFTAICEKMGVASLPASFEMMFLVRLWPGDLDDEASEAQLINWRLLQDR
jgi:hypothetical protein